MCFTKRPSPIVLYGGYDAKACPKLNKPKEEGCFTWRYAHQRANNQIEEDIRDSEEGSKEIRADSPSIDSRHQERQITQQNYNKL
jgi:hypothetical protein